MHDYVNKGVVIFAKEMKYERECIRSKANQPSASG